MNYALGNDRYAILNNLILVKKVKTMTTFDSARQSAIALCENASLIPENESNLWNPKDLIAHLQPFFTLSESDCEELLQISATEWNIPFTHPSFANEKNQSSESLSEHFQKCESYERLEFLGDAVMGLMIARELYELYPEKNEGALSKQKASLVSAKSFAVLFDFLGLQAFARLGSGEQERVKLKTGASENMKADIFEACMGFLFLKLGEAKLGTMLKNMWRVFALKHGDFFQTEWNFSRDYKSLLQITMQKKGWGLPFYQLKAKNRVFNEELKVMQDVFEVQLDLENAMNNQNNLQHKLSATALSTSKKVAEKMVAQKMYQLINEIDGEQK